MMLSIAGMGWVTPLGSGVVAPVWQQLLDGAEALASNVTGPENSRSSQVFRVPTAATANAPAHPRLRRSSAISRFAVVAGLAALEDAKISMSAEVAERTALIFAIANGGVVYTKRFYHDVVETGAQAASPLLFPETVFNAPASHLAAILGITGASYTLVGDAAVGVLAVQMAEDLMQNEAIDRCLVVGAEEADWLLCDAYRRWRLLRPAPPVEPFASAPRGMILSEGAGALLLARDGTTRIDKIAPGTNYTRQNEAAAGVDRVFAELCDEPIDLVVASANGTFVDGAEAAAARAHCAAAAIYTPKPALGEGVGAGAIWQIICAACALDEGTSPPVLHAPGFAPLRLPPDHAATRRALVSVCGLNQQVAGLRLSRAD